MLTKVLYGALVTLVGLTVIQQCSNKALRAERERLERNQVALLADIEIVQDKYDRSVTKVAALELSKKELTTLNEHLAQQVTALGLKISRLQGLVEAVAETTDSITIPLAPPITIARDSLPPIIKRDFRFEDDYTNIWGAITLDGDHDRLNLHYTVRDTLDVIIYRTPKRFLFIPYGIKKIDCYLYPHNPHATVVTGTCIIRKQGK